MTAPLVAIDLGATSGRVVVGQVGPSKIEINEVHRFANEPLALPDGLHWNITELYRQVLVGLRTVAESFPPPVSVGIDSWAIDYGLLDRHGHLASIPYHYRAERTGAAAERVHERIPVKQLYGRSGVQFLAFNTIYQLEADRETGLLDRAQTMLLIPDLIGYWLTGQSAAELTNASTTAVLGVRSHRWDDAVIERLGLPRRLFPDVREPGSVLGPIGRGLAKETRLPESAVVTLVGSHDTASAFVGTPATNSTTVFISCGTWALVGLELDEPVVNEQSRLSGFTNEAGVDGSVRFLHNVMGMWLLEECLREWRAEGSVRELQPLLGEAAELPRGGPRIDPNDAQFFAPGRMAERIVEACRAVGTHLSASPANVVRCILESLASAFADTIREAESLTGMRCDVVHIVGGGSRNQLLCQLTADASGLLVLAGPAEATALGNLLVQARTHGLIAGSLADMRSLLNNTQQITRYEPTSVASAV